MSGAWRVLFFILVLAVLITGGFLILRKDSPPPAPLVPTAEVPSATLERVVIGRSVQGREIIAHHFGEGAKKLLFVGGIHGGYEGNSVMLAYQFIDYLKANPSAIPSGMSVAVIPNANPDGYALGPGAEARFNARGVDLNRNFDCKWQAESNWRQTKVSGGTSAFSEPETRAIRDFVLANKPAAAIFWHSQASAVYASECEAGIIPETRAIMNAYATASGYQPVDSFDAYAVTGDAEGWLASIGIPAITVELKTHETIEWSENLAGIQALFEYFGKY